MAASSDKKPEYPRQARRGIKRFTVPVCHAVLFFLPWANLGQEKPQDPEQSERVPREFLEIRLAMGQGKYAEAHKMIDRLFKKQEVYPPLFETAASLYAFENRFAEGHTYFDSLLARGQPNGDIAGAQAILYHLEKRPEFSLQQARIAVLENCQSLWPYEIFVFKSFELDSSEAGLDLLRRQRQLHNWRLRYALAIGLTSQNKVKEACDSLQALLHANIKHPRIFYTLGLYRGYMGSWDEAKRTHLAGLAHHTPAQDDPERARLLHGLAEALFMRGKPDSAGQVLDSAFVLAEKYDERLLKYRQQ